MRVVRQSHYPKQHHLKSTWVSDLDGSRNYVITGLMILMAKPFCPIGCVNALERR